MRIDGFGLHDFLAWVFKMPLVSNLEYKIYKCHLDVSEANRIHANIELIKPIAIAIEDKSFLPSFWCQH